MIMKKNGLINVSISTGKLTYLAGIQAMLVVIMQIWYFVISSHFRKEGAIFEQYSTKVE